MKRRAKLIPAVLIGCLSAKVALAQESAILNFIETNRQEGFGSGFISLQEEGVLHGEVSSTVVIYGYQIGENGDRSHPQYMAVFDTSSATSELIAGPILIGGSGTQQFDQLAIEDKTIVLKGAMWVAGDAACCPSGIARIEYSCSHGSCMARGK